MVAQIPAARLERLRELVDREGVVSLRQAQASLEVSEMTVRRDFATLEEMGLVRRTRGGVIGLGRLVPDVPSTERQSREVAGKAAIGECAARFITEGDTIFLSGGTTCLALARALHRHNGVTVITNSVSALPELMRNPGLTVLATGGLASSANDDLTGQVAEAMLAQFRASKAFVGASAIRADGVYNANLARAATDRMMAERASEVFVLADHTKVAASALALVMPLSTVSTLVTDMEPRKGDRDWLRASGLRTVVATDGGDLEAGDGAMA